MTKPKTPNQKSKYSELNKRLAGYVSLIQSVYETLNMEAAKIVENLGVDDVIEEPFSFSHYPETQKKMAEIQKRFVDDIWAVIYRGTSDEWKNSNEVQDLLANNVLKAYEAVVDKEKYKVLYQTNSDALKAFQNRKDKGFNVSEKLWNQSVVYKKELEDAISCAIEKGMSAVTLSKRISKYLQDFPQLQRDYREKFGIASKAMDCEYRSIRLAASEINMAYRAAENKRWEQMDFVVGYEIKLSGNHTLNGKPFTDICDSLAGKYPKDFVWTGWHPLCYSDDSEVLTDKGWKLFKDVCRGDLILSLNPTNRNVEWVGISALQCYAYNGSMVHFYNRSLDCLVTPDHQMVYLSKSNGKIMRCPASSYRKGNGAFYRGCEYVAQDVDTITIGGTKIDFDLFCEFMGYWLSDGSTIRKSQIVISQQDGEKAKPFIVSCIERMGLKPHVSYSKIDFYNNDICLYLKRFGTCIEKYVPKEIKEASKRQIRIFLDAFIKCDGYIKKPRPFVGNRGGYCKGTEERMYFTTSNQLASDLGEMILKIGKRPSYRILSVAGKEIQFKNGLYKTNYDEITISECTSVTATVFDKEIISYNGKVYDLTLERNHIMYIRRRGKCFWGSNCRCYKIPILKTEEEFWSWDGRSEVSTDSVNSVKDVPENFKQWVGTNSRRIAKSEKRGTLPYFIRDNLKRVDDILTATPLAVSLVYSIGGIEQLNVLDGRNYELTKNVSDVENSIRMNKGFETGVVFNANGDKVIDKRGEGSYVRFTKEELSIMKDCIFTHNHPGGWEYADHDIGRIGNSFSIQDIVMAVGNNLSEMRAVTPNYTFSMKRPQKGWGISVERLVEEYNKENTRLRKEFTGRINNGTLTISQANATHFHILWRNLSEKLGFEYYKMKTK